MKLFVRVLIRWFWFLPLCLILGWFIGKVASNLIPPTYEATAIVQLNAQSHTSTIIQPVAAYATLVASDSILGNALKNYPNLDRSAVVSKQLVVNSDDPSQSITIQLTLTNPKQAASLSNELAQLLVTQQNAYIKSEYTKQLEIVNNRIAEEQKTIDQLSQKIISTPTSTPNYTATIQQYQNEISQQQSLQSQDITTRQDLLTQQALYSDPLSVIESATVPTKPSSIIGLIPLPLVVSVVMLLIGAFAIFMFERWSDRINGVYSLQKRTDLPLIGTLRWSRPMTLNELCNSKVPYAEDCRVMMADVLFQAEQSKAHVIALTSIRTGAGTSCISAQLAALLAQSKRSVLLIDANLYRPSLHEQVNVPNATGLATLLEQASKIAGFAGQQSNGSIGVLERLSLDSFIMPTTMPNLFILPAGTSKMNPSDLLSMPEMGQFLKRASRPIDFIIIDCPALNYGDTHMLGALSDQTLVVVDATKDRVKRVVSTKDELNSSGIKFSGLIVNKLGRWI